jgi:hypothetical protein
MTLSPGRIEGCLADDGIAVLKTIGGSGRNRFTARGRGVTMHTLRRLSFRSPSVSDQSNAWALSLIGWLGHNNYPLK